MTPPVKPRVLVALRPTGVEPPSLLKKAGDLADFVFAVTADDIGEEAAAVDSAFVWNFRSTLVPDAIDRLPRLRWVHVAASGVDASLSDEVRARGIAFTNSRGVTAPAMAEYALMLMLAHAKDLPGTIADQAAKVWRPRESRMLSGATLVAIGVGPVNRELARRAGALGMTVIGVGRRPRDGVDGFDRVVGSDQLLDVLPLADHVVIATPLTGETRGLIGAAELAALPDGAHLVNLGRGAVVDEAALMAALGSGRLGGAGLDVLWREPLEPEHALWETPGVVLSPHTSSDFVGWEDAMVDLFVRNLRRALGGEPLLNVVDLDLGYAPID
ncbi:D-2-hydroxyacid dehydrogenase [Jiangella sp. DSM 45060]|uniref:D-2-hydroxyacid dehydrogenase n=1 Tax=Jiangella sp. DSM 45060 TaxID=1798224 RepID=UPI000B8128C3|nr:D-2-hydroxyacid dehydrogenase [Jiangella sp. DSM 45060]